MHWGKATSYELRQISIIKVAKDLGIEVKNKMAVCYNEHDTKPSLSISAQKNLFKCFGCGDQGSVIDLVMKVLCKDFKSACQWLTEKYISFPMEGREKYLKQPQIRFPKSESTKSAPNSTIYEWIIANTTLSEKAISYLHGTRKIKMEVIQKLKIRSIDDPSSLYSKLLRNFGELELMACGVTKTFNNGKIGFIWWIPVILFPCFDLNFRINYIQGRPFDQTKVKHLNLNGISPQLYNLEQLHEMKYGDQLMFCEGITDTLTALSMGHHAIGVLGAHNFNPKDSRKFMDYDIAVVPDSDAGGNHFVKNLKNAFSQHGKNIDVLPVPEGYNDLNELFVKENSRFQ